MYKVRKADKTSIKLNQSQEGETIEQKIRRITNNKEAISDGAPLIFTERKDGVQPQYDIRTDRFELAVDAMDVVAKQHLAKRQSNMTVSKDEPSGKPSSGSNGDSSDKAA